MGRWTFLLCLFFYPLTWAVEFNTNIHITAKDGTRLAANLFHHTDSSSQHPAIIFINSWVLEEHEYFLKARQLANAGYNVLSYSARGWGTSEGFVDVASPADVQDLSSAIDYLLQNTNTDPQRIGASGISYGAGISLLSTAFDPRIRAVAAMSGWVDLQDSLSPGNTTNFLWSNILLYLGMATGRLSDTVKNYVRQLNRYENIDQIMAWAKLRSAATYINETNKNQTAILIINSWYDSLFNPNSIIQYFKNLNTPKKLILQDGIHAVTEGGSLIRFDISQSWDHVQTWFDEHLKNQPRAQFSSPYVELQVRGTSRYEILSGDILSSQNMPSPNPVQTYAMLWPDKKSPETLVPLSAVIPEPEKKSEGSVSIQTEKDSVASSGIPVLGAFLDSYLRIPVAIKWSSLNTEKSFSFKTPALKTPLKLRGISSTSIHVKSSSPYQTLVAYLYSINRFGFAQLITHGAVTFESSPEKNSEKIDISFFATAYDVPTGHRVGLVIDGKDEIYSERQKNPAQVQLHFSNDNPNILNLQTSF